MGVYSITMDRTVFLTANADSKDKELVLDSLNLQDKIKNTISDIAIGKYVIIHSQNEGLNAGYLKDADSTGVVLTAARRLWYPGPKAKTVAWYEGVAMYGLSESSKISCPVTVKIIIEAYSITLCSEISKSSIVNFKSHEQS